MSRLDFSRRSATVRRFRRSISTRPWLYFAIAKATGNVQLLREDTELVVDGFPRSANSFTEAAFRHSQAARGLRIASHAHSAAQVLRAIERGVPALVLLRHPDEAVASMMGMLGDDQAAEHFADYCAFYRPLLGRENGFVTAEFSQIVSRFDDVVRAVNDRFGLDLLVPELGAAFDAGVAAVRDRVSIARVGETPDYSEIIGNDVLTARKARQAQLFEDVRRLDLAARYEALELFEHFRARAEIA